MLLSSKTSTLHRGSLRISNLDDDELLIQILHEDTYPVKGPAILARFQGVHHETHAKSAGFERHHATEVAAVEARQRLFEAHAPELLPAYSKWKKRYATA